MGHAIIRGETYEEKFASADKALSQIMRRVDARKIIAPLTPIVVMGYCREDDNGVIFKGMFPVSGFITKVSLFIEKLEDDNFLKNNSLRICVKFYQENGTEVKREFPTRKLYIGEFISYAIGANSRVEVSLNVKAFGIWYGFIMEPEIPILKQVEFSDVEVLAPEERAMIEE